ncbi:MAG: SMC family ATPase [Candidatus Altiarchaeota archaeon]
MQLLHLSLENWACHDSLSIDLSKGLQIEGRNGTGKSSILEAIKFIFTEQSRGYRNKIKNGKDFAKVRLMLKKESDTFLIEKILPRNKTVKAKIFKNTLLIADSLTAVHSQLKEILDEEILEKLLYIPQGRLTEILDALKIKGGRQELDSLLGLDKFEKIYNSAGEEILKKREKLLLLKDELKKFPEDDNFFKNEIEKIQRNIEKSLVDSEKLEAEIFSIREKLEKVKEKISEIEKIKKAREITERELNELNLKIVKIGDEINSNVKLLETLNEKKVEFSALTKEIEKLKNYPKIRELLLEKKNLEERIKELLVAEDKERIKLLETELKNFHELQIVCNKKEKELIELEKEFAIQKEKILEKMNFLKDLEELKKQQRCPRCGQILTIEHIEREKEETYKEIEEIKEKGVELERRLNIEREIFEKQKKEVEILKRKEVELITLKSQIDKKNIERRNSEKKICDIEKELFDIGYKNESLNEVEKQVNNLNNFQGRINELQKDVKKISEIEEKLPKLKEELSTAEREKFSIEKRAKELVYDENLFENLRKEKETLNEDFYKLQVELKSQNFRVNEMKTQLKKIEDERKNFLDLKEEVRNLERELNLLEKARDLFHTDKGIPKYLREKYIAKLNFLLTSYFHKINQNPNYKEVYFNKEYELELKANDGSLSIEQISGGEKTQLAIAFRLSLIDLLSPIRLLILDEPFGSLDQEHREMLGGVLNKIAEEGQVILVTHIPVETLNLYEKLNLGEY